MSCSFFKPFLLFLLVFVCLCSCSSQGLTDVQDGILVCTWNVQNLFDCQVDGTEYEEYLPSSGWNLDSYSNRLSNVSRVISYLPKYENLILVLNEVENAHVVEDIITQRDISDRGLHWFASAGEEGGAIQTAVISSLPITSAYVHDVGENLRPILEIGLDTPKGKVFVLALHAKSNIGEFSETSASRLKAGEVVKTIAQNLENTFPGCIILVCGDINEECYDNNVMGRAKQTECPLPVSAGFEQRRWYCPWLDSSNDVFPGGSYYYNGAWKCYDNVLVSYTGGDGAGWDVSGFGVVFKGILKTPDGKPNSWNRVLLKGVSDHLPVWVSLE